MKAYRISGFHIKTGEYLVANVAAISLEEAIHLMSITHRRLVCLDKRGVEL